MKFCPYDCARCDDPDCRRDGCKVTGEPMCDVCDSCGEVFMPAAGLVICAACIDCDA